MRVKQEESESRFEESVEKIVRNLRGKLQQARSNGSLNSVVLEVAFNRCGISDHYFTTKEKGSTA